MTDANNKISKLETRLEKAKAKKAKSLKLRNRAEEYRIGAAKKLEMLHQNLRLARAARCFKRTGVNKDKVSGVLQLLRKGRQYNREAMLILYKMQNLRSKKVQPKIVKHKKVQKGGDENN